MNVVSSCVGDRRSLKSFQSITQTGVLWEDKILKLFDFGHLFNTHFMFLGIFSA